MWFQRTIAKDFLLKQSCFRIVIYRDKGEERYIELEISSRVFALSITLLKII